MSIEVFANPPRFADWGDLYDLIVECFSYMEGRIDPPSSIYKASPESLRIQARSQDLIIALENGKLLGCVFGLATAETYYIGKLAVLNSYRGRGIAREMLDAATQLARHKGFNILELETRIELNENHSAFKALGFQKTAESTHPGYTRATSFTFQKPI